MSVSPMRSTGTTTETIGKSTSVTGNPVINMSNDTLGQLEEVPQVLYGPAPPSPNDAVEELELNLDELYDTESHSSGGSNAVENLDDISIEEYLPKILEEKYGGRDISSLSKEEFLDCVSGYAQVEYLKTGVLPSIVIALAIQESNWGQNCEGNNLFGLKANENWEGKTLSVPIEEINSNGERIKSREDFKYYDSPEQGIKDFCEMISKNERYSKVIEACNRNDVTEACKSLKECGFATSSNFTDNLIETIIDNNLGQYNPK